MGVVFVDQGNIEAGFSIPGLRLRVLGDREIFGQPPKRVKLRAVKEGVPVTLADLKVGDHVVHAVHGIGQYLGLRTETILGATSDYLDLKYAGTDRMLVPVTQMHQVTKYGAAVSGSSARMTPTAGTGRPSPDSIRAPRGLRRPSRGRRTGSSSGRCTPRKANPCATNSSASAGSRCISQTATAH